MPPAFAAPPAVAGARAGQRSARTRACRRRTSVCAASAATAGQPLRTGVLVSGGGRSLENLCARIADGRLTGIDVTVVVASRATSGALGRAATYGVPARVVRPVDYDRDAARHSDAVSAVLDEFRVDLVVLAGWLHFYLIPDRFARRVVNIHPSLIPAFCGKGYFGHHVHQAVLDFGAKVTGCTVHIADNEYDNGPIVLQRAVPVMEDDDADSLADRVFLAETEALPAALQLFADGRLQIEGAGKRVRVLPAAAAAAINKG
jgi:phosphoribosylglycinamide formyltransferase 1